MGICFIDCRSNRHFPVIWPRTEEARKGPHGIGSGRNRRAGKMVGALPESVTPYTLPKVVIMVII